jgi:hypothetical protein
MAQSAADSPMPPSGQESKPQKVIVVKTDRDRVLEAVSILVGWGVAYWVLHPELGEAIKDWTHRRMERLRHKASVWQAKREIQNLPETDE